AQTNTTNAAQTTVIQSSATPRTDASEGLIPYLHSKGETDATMEKIAPGIEDCFINLLKD
ncbi:MAG TPA: hypothetical protein VL727_01205, partial [Puia sp.]|nr:hypothetical protein [Puia sp.]